jgi:hypothetical protein
VYGAILAGCLLLSRIILLRPFAVRKSAVFREIPSNWEYDGRKALDLGHFQSGTGQQEYLSKQAASLQCFSRVFFQSEY